MDESHLLADLCVAAYPVVAARTGGNASPDEIAERVLQHALAMQARLAQHAANHPAAPGTPAQPDQPATPT